MYLLQKLNIINYKTKKLYTLDKHVNCYILKVFYHTHYLISIIKFYYACRNENIQL